MREAGPTRDHAVEVEGGPDGAVLTVRGFLDETAGRTLVETTATVAAGDACRLEIDLCFLTGFNEPGAVALVACRELCASLPQGLHYRTGRGPGREALLAAYAES